MVIYTIHSRGLEPDRTSDAQFLGDGFSWVAFWLGPIWLLRHGLYAACVAWVAAMVILAIAASTGLPPAAATIVVLAIQALLGLEANPLRQGKLAREGYSLVDIVAAKNLDEAEVFFFRRHATAGGLPPDPAERP